MKTQVKMWGNSLAVRIPKAFAEEMKITSDSPVDISVSDRTLVIKLVTEAEPSLEELLAGITEDNLHRETDWGPAVGNEAW